MCPAGIRFYRTCLYRTILNRTPAAAFEVFDAKPNPERVGFVLGTSSQEIWYGPVIDGVRTFSGRFIPLGAPYQQELNIEHYGPLIMGPWQFWLTDAAGTYTIYEIVAPKDFQ